MLCTHKDLVKLAVPELGCVPLWALVVEMRVLCGERELLAALERIAAAIE